MEPTTKIGFFEEAPGQKSSNRLIFICGSFYAMAMGAWVFAETKSWVAAVSTVSGIAVVFMGGKLIQKSQETNKP